MINISAIHLENILLTLGFLFILYIIYFIKKKKLPYVMLPALFLLFIILCYLFKVNNIIIFNIISYS